MAVHGQKPFSNTLLNSQKLAKFWRLATFQNCYVTRENASLTVIGQNKVAKQAPGTHYLREAAASDETM